MTRMLALIAALALAACEQSVAPSPRPQRPSVQSVSNDFDDVIRDNFQLEFTGTIDSPCTGETISFDGSTHIVMTLDESDTGATLQYHLNTQGVSGVGLETGTKYQIVQVTSEDANAIFIPANESGSVTIHERIISDGGADNFLADVIFTFTSPPPQATYQLKNLRCVG